MAKENQKKIIVAEDDAAMATIISRKLADSGFEVRHAENGHIAVEMFEKDPPALILLDLMMPELDGFGVLQKIRSNPDPKLAKTSIIVLSNLWSNEDILKAQGFKVSAYMVKSYFTPEEILNKINEVLSKNN